MIYSQRPFQTLKPPAQHSPPVAPAPPLPQFHPQRQPLRQDQLPAPITQPAPLSPPPWRPSQPLNVAAPSPQRPRRPTNPTALSPPRRLLLSLAPPASSLLVLEACSPLALLLLLLCKWLPTWSLDGGLSLINVGLCLVQASFVLGRLRLGKAKDSYCRLHICGLQRWNWKGWYGKEPTSEWLLIRGNAFGGCTFNIQKIYIRRTNN
jgi:hypothetical protein